MELLTLLGASLTGIGTVMNLAMWFATGKVFNLLVAIVTFTCFLYNLSVIF